MKRALQSWKISLSLCPSGRIVKLTHRSIISLISHWKRLNFLALPLVMTSAGPTTWQSSPHKSNANWVFSKDPSLSLENQNYSQYTRPLFIVQWSYALLYGLVLQSYICLSWILWNVKFTKLLKEIAKDLSYNIKKSKASLVLTVFKVPFLLYVFLGCRSSSSVLRCYSDLIYFVWWNNVPSTTLWSLPLLLVMGSHGQTSIFIHDGTLPVELMPSVHAACSRSTAY